jgi:DNA polymerase-1
MAAKKKQPTEQPKRLVLLDAHAILHRAYHALPDFSTTRGEPTGALYGLSAMIIGVIETLKPDYIVACYDVKGPTYRHEAYKEYKAQRKAADDALVAQMGRSRDVFHALNIPIYDKEGFEADDMLGTIVEQVTRAVTSNETLNPKSETLNKSKIRNSKKATKRGLLPVEIIIASGDMDTLQLVRGEEVKVYTFKKGIKDTIMYDENAVKERFGFGPERVADYKGLRGDPSDNIIGVKGIGEKTATILITSFGSIEDIYKHLEKGDDKAFIKAGITPRIIQLLRDNKEEAEFSKMLATIRRDAPITFVMPEKTFKESLDVKKVTALWNELEFRMLVQRLQKALTGVSGAAPTGSKSATVSTSKPYVSEEESDRGADKVVTNSLFRDTEALAAAIDKTDFNKTAVALWLVNSNLTNPTLDDVLNFANTDAYEEAKKVIMAELDKRNLRNLYNAIELPLIPVTEKMEKRGVKIDDVFLADLSKKYHTEATRLKKIS